MFILNLPFISQKPTYGSLLKHDKHHSDCYKFQYPPFNSISLYYSWNVFRLLTSGIENSMQIYANNRPFGQLLLVFLVTNFVSCILMVKYWVYKCSEQLCFHNCSYEYKITLFILFDTAYWLKLCFVWYTTHAFSFVCIYLL